MNNTNSLSDLFITSCQKYSEKIAIIYNDSQITYRTFLRDVLTFREYLFKFNLSHQDRVVIHGANDYPLIVLYWSVILAGGTVSFFPFDCDDTALDFMLKNLEPKLVIGIALSSNQVRVYNKQLFDMDGIFFRDHNEFKCFAHDLIKTKVDDKSERIISSDLAMIIYTSGSTGKPKGVMLTHDNMLHALRSINGYLNITEQDIIFSVLPLHFDYGLYQMLLSIYAGATLLIDQGMIYPSLFLQRIEKYQVTILPVLPNIISILSALNTKELKNFKSVKKVTNTGERLSNKHIETIKKLFVNAELYLMYGLTECKRCSYVPPQMLTKKKNSIGIPMPNLEMFVVDSDGNKVTAGEVGEIVVNSPTIMQGYWRSQLLTKEKLKEDSRGCRILYTGDIGYQDVDGYFYLVSRNDSMIKINGEKCHLGNHAARLESCSDVDRAHLFLTTIGDDSDLVACIETKVDEQYSGLLNQSLKKIMPLNLQPTYFYVSQAFPSLPNGKLNYRQLESDARKSLSDNIIESY